MLTLKLPYVRVCAGCSHGTWAHCRYVMVLALSCVCATCSRMCECRPEHGLAGFNILITMQSPSKHCCKKVLGLLLVLRNANATGLHPNRRWDVAVASAGITNVHGKVMQA